MLSEPPWESLRVWAVGQALHYGAGDDAEDVAHEALLRLVRADRAGRHYPAGAAYAAVRTAVRWALSDRALSAEGRLRQCRMAYDLSAPAVVRDDLTPWLALANDDHERATVMALARGLTPADQAAQWPALFPAVTDAYRVRHRLVSRVRSQRRAGEHL